MTRLLVDGSPLLADGSPLEPSGVFADHFTRGGVDQVVGLGNGWVDLASVFPSDYDPAGILNGNIVTRALTRAGFAGLPYSPDPDGVGDDFLNHPGRVAPGIGGAWRQTAWSDVDVEVLWSGNLGIETHTEATPLVCVTPSSPMLGFGVWPSTYGPQPLFLIGVIGRPPEDFATVGGVALFSHADGTPRRVRLVTAGGGATCTLWLDGVQVSTELHGLDPIPIPAELHGSTLHGFAVDQHLVGYSAGVPSLSNMQAAAALSAITIQEA